MTTTFTTNYGFDKPAISDTGWGGIRNQNMDDLDAELFKPRIGQSALSWGATTTVDLSLARVFVGTNNQVSTIAFSNVPNSFPNGAAVPVVMCDLILTNGGAFAITWPASIVWLAGGAPILKASGVDVVRLVTRDGGTTWYGAHLIADNHRVLYQNHNVTTVSTSEASLASYTIPANALSVNGQAIRFTVVGRAETQNATALKVKFGATDLFNFTPAAGRIFHVTGIVARLSPTTQIAVISWTDNSQADTTQAITDRQSPGETLSGTVLLDFRGSVVSGGTLRFDSIQVEYLAA